MQKKILKHIAILIVFIFLVNLLAIKFHWYFTIWWFDMPIHFLGGFFISLAVLWLYFYRNPWSRFKITPAFISLLSVFIIGVLWEIFEFSLDRSLTINLLSPIDSISDLFFDLSGGIVGTMYMLRKIC